MTVIQGRWRIIETDVWDQEALDLVGPAAIELTATGGTVRFIAVEGDIDPRPSVRNGSPAVEFSWEGVDEGDPASGRGWAVLEADGTLRGHLFLHRGDDSPFVAVPIDD